MSSTDEHDPPSDRPSDDAIDDSSDADSEFVGIQRVMSHKRRMERENCADTRLQQLLPFSFSLNIWPLTPADLASCCALENAAFVKEEYRATPEKFEYRLARCPELSLGVFCTVVPSQAKELGLETLPVARPVETDRENKAVSVLLAHIVSTRCTSDVVTDESMDYPKDWKTAHRGSGSDAPAVGHQEHGETVALHSLAVLPKLHGCGLGKLIMKSYIQQMNDSGTAKRIALLCQDYLVSYYEKFGFKHKGESRAQLGGGGWHDMVIDLPGPATSPPARGAPGI